MTTAFSGGLVGLLLGLVVLFTLKGSALGIIALIGLPIICGFLTYKLQKLINKSSDEAEYKYKKKHDENDGKEQKLSDKFK